MELATLSDRAAGIVATTLLENSLDGVLVYMFVNSEASLLKEIFSENGPLATFSAKIRLAFALGLVTAEGRHDLDIVRKVRNSFAHDIGGNTFESITIRDRCLSLKMVDHFVSFEELTVRTPPGFTFPAS